jgi:hypothetical protein
LKTGKVFCFVPDPGSIPYMSGAINAGQMNLKKRNPANDAI